MERFLSGMEWYKSVLRKYAVFDGRARRKEYWIFTLYDVSFTLAIFIMDTILIGLGSLITYAYLLALTLPRIAVNVRRLHDIGISGWVTFVMFLPILGPLALLVLHCINGATGRNSYGDDPKAADRETAFGA